MKVHPEKLKSWHIDTSRSLMGWLEVSKFWRNLTSSRLPSASWRLPSHFSPQSAPSWASGAEQTDRQTDSSCRSRGLALLRLCLGRESVEELLAPRQTRRREEQQKFVERPTQPLGPALWPLLSSGHALCSSDWSQCHSKWMDGVSLFASSEGSCML